MSSIYGVAYRTAEEHTLADALGGLEYWNRNYGRQDHAQTKWDCAAMGCHIRHISTRFPHGGPILDLHGDPAVVDALLFNRDELLEALSLPAAEPVSDEVLLVRYIEQFGFDALARVNGDFAGAVYCREADEWILFRDHMGVRPLFYYLDHDIFAFSSDLRGLTALPGADLTVNEMKIYHDFLMDNFITGCETEFQRIRSLQPAAIVRFRMTEEAIEATEQRYWQPRQKKIRFRTDAEYQQELRRLVTDAVQRRCNVSEDPLGAELSGGLDSSVIDILISRSGRELKCFSWSSAPSVTPVTDPRDERLVIDAICAQEGFTCRYNCSEDKAAYRQKHEWLPLPYVTTKPLGIGSNYLRSQGARVVFTGHTGDEGVSHRAGRFELFWHKEYLAYFKLYWQDLAGHPLRLVRAVRAGIRDARADFAELHWKPEESFYYPPMLRNSFCDRMRKDYSYIHLPFRFDPAAYISRGGSLHRFMMTAYYGAFCDVQYLFPYADYRVIDFALSIPRRLFLSRTLSRKIFRDAFGDLMPKELAAVNIKSTVSKQNREEAAEPEELFRKRIDLILADLDQDRWKDILDYESIAALKPIHGGNEAFHQFLRLHYLVRFVDIQNIQNNSRNWREYDAKDKETV